MLGHLVGRENRIDPWFIRIGRNDIPRNPRVITEIIKVPWFINVGRNNIPSNFRVRAEFVKIPWFIRVRSIS